MEGYPYIVSNNKIEPILAKIRSAARPDRVTAQLLKKWGFTASNDRAMLRVLKVLGFLTENGAPTEHYDHLRDQNNWRHVLGERIRDAYSELYSIDEKIHGAPENEIKGAISRVTGKDETLVNRYFTTFKTLAGLAKFDGTPATKERPKVATEPEESRPSEGAKSSPAGASAPPPPTFSPAFHYNIQIHLPATTDVAVYNAIFKTLKEHLLV